MSSRDLNNLLPEVKKAANKVIGICESRNLNILIYCTSRTLEEQAMLYRSTRTYNQIIEKKNKLEYDGFTFLADILMNVGPQSGQIGKHVTYACCGESLHNYGMAFDAVPVIEGELMWDANHLSWKKYGDAVVEASLEWGGNWTNFKDYPHAQLSRVSNPLREYNPERIKFMLNRSGMI